jgi:Arc/MetJ-type ribon-helix-helix transcriptional regulator
MSGYAKVYISMPHQFLAELDRTAEAEHLSRSGLIREAVKLYLTMAGRRGTRPRFFEMTDSLRGAFEGRTDDDLERLIDRAVDHARDANAG